MWPGSRPTSIPSGILIHAAVWPQYTWAEYLGFCLLFGEGELVLHLTNVAWVEAYLSTKWHLDPSSRLGTMDMGRKLGALQEGELGPI